MATDDLFKFLLKRGDTDGVNIPFIPEGKYFVVGYNDTYGLLDVCEKDNGEPYFEGRVNIESLLLETKSERREVINTKVYIYIMKSYTNFWNYRNNLEKYDALPTPILEVLTNKSI